MNRSLAILGVAAALLLALAGSAAADTLGPTSLVDRPSGSGELPFDGVSDAAMTIHALSADGRFVVFSSSSDVLLDGDDDSSTNVYRLDRRNGTVAQVNTGAGGEQPSLRSSSLQASVSANGRYVEFISNATTLVPGAPAAGFYVKDMQTGAIELASRGTGANGAPATVPRAAVISGDGRHVAFAAGGILDADNVDGVQNGTDAYLRSLDTNVTHMVSVTAAGLPGSGVNSGHVDVDFGGDAVAFLSTTRLNADDTENEDDVYVRTGIGGTESTRFASFSTGQTGGADRVGSELTLSGAGNQVAWGNGFGNIFMANLLRSVAPAIFMAKSRPGGTGSGGIDPVFEPVADGASSPRRLTFRAFQKLDPADTNEFIDLYGAELAHPGDGSFVHLETSGTAKAPVISGAAAEDGSAIVFAAAAPDLPGGDGVRSQIYLHAGASDRNISQPDPPRTSAAGSASVDPRAVSDDGRVIAFSSSAPAFGSPPPPPSSNGFQSEVLVRDLASGQTTLASVGTDGKPGDRSSGRASIDAAGDRVVFISQATNLVAGATTGQSHAYLRDLSAGTTTLIDRSAAGAPLTQGIQETRISADGRHVVYASRSPDAPGAPAGDTNEHVYVVDLGTGGTELADRATGPAGAIANKDSFRVDIDGDGNRVSFVNTAANLGAGDPGGNKHQAYVRDLTAKTTTWASVPEDANPTHANVDDPLLSRDGTRVAFEQFDPLFGNGMTGQAQIYLRDLGAATTKLVSADTGLADTRAFNPSISADGTRVSFTAQPGDAFVRSQVFLRDVPSASTTLVSTARDGSPGRLGASGGAISGNGACVAFGSTSDDLVSPGYGPDFGHVFQRCVAPPTGGGGDGGGGGGGGNGGGGPGPVGDGPKPKDRTAPVISKASVSNRRFSVASGRTALAAAKKTPRGTTFGFKLSEKATTTIAITTVVKRKRRTLITLTRKGTRSGTNRVAFTGRTTKATLKPGVYEAQLTARDAAGNRSKTVKVSFRVVR